VAVILEIIVFVFRFSDISILSSRSIESKTLEVNMCWISYVRRGYRNVIWKLDNATDELLE